MKHKLILTITMLLSAICALYAQSFDQNFIRTITYTDENGYYSNSLQTIQYFDGLGRPTQTVKRGFTPDKKDLVILQEYDDFGRESNIWLPAPQSLGNGEYVTPATIKTSAQTFYNGDTAPYSYPVYENSPLNRVLEQYGPGQDWHNPINAKSVKTDYKTNTAGGDELSCTKYTISGNNLVNSGNYTANELYVVETIDEDGNFSYVFTDKLGRTLLTRFINDSENHDVYYVYDDLNNLRFVLPPLAVSATGDEDNPVMKKYAYVYKYDSRNRMIFKQLPGCEYVKYIYDKADRLIFWQDGELRNSDIENEKWMFSIPDVFGRIVITGICGNSALGKTINASNFENVIITAKKSTNINSGMHGYDIYLNSTVVQTSGLANMKELTVNWFDNYNFLTLNAINSSGVTLSYETNEHSDFDKMYGNSNDIVAHKGLLTGSAVAMLEGNTMLYSAFYYDYRRRLIQTKSINHLGGAEKEYIEYDFIGNPLKKLHVHSVPNKPEIRELYENEYDHAGRLLKTTHILDDATYATTISSNSYDQIGRLEWTFNSVTSKIEYDYDVRSRIETISAFDFAQNISYTYGGNIEEMKWKNNRDGTNYPHKYFFEYDNLSRVKKAFHNGDTFASSGQYNEYFEYDKHGNIESLKRYTKGSLIVKPHEPSFMDSLEIVHYGSRFSEEDMERGLASTLADNLTMQYDGNQLTKVTEASSHSNIASDEYFFMDWFPNTQTDYEYNANGAMLKDENKGMTVDYNILNLPRNIYIYNPVVSYGQIGYGYSADGVKRKVKHWWVETGVKNPHVTKTSFEVIEEPPSLSILKSKTTDYVGNKIYEDGVLEKILLPNGYIKENKYFSYIRDHLGNNRVVMTQQSLINDTIAIGDPLEGEEGLEDRNGIPMFIGKVVQRVDYYPGSGLPMAGGLNPEEQPYKYNNLEFQTMHGLNWCDAHARPYMSDLVRTPTFDPLAEARPWESPYSWCGNNLVRNIDPSGMIWDDHKVVVKVANNIDKQISSLEKSKSNALNKLDSDNGNMSNRKVERLTNQMTDSQNRIEHLEQSKSDIFTLAKDQDNVYSLNKIDGGMHYVTQGNDGKINIDYSTTSTAIHEITHIRQSLKAGGLQFEDGKLINAVGHYKEGTSKLDHYKYYSANEVEAYQKQYSYDRSFPGIRDGYGVSGINVHSVGNIMHNDKPLYKKIQDYSILLKQRQKFTQ